MLRECFDKAETYLIVTHVQPDGDAISSSIAMYNFLVSVGKKPQNIEVYIPHVSNDLSFIDKNNILKKNCAITTHDLVIILDCSDLSRVEGSSLLEYVPAQQCILIDHHEPSGISIEADYSVVDTSASSCTCIIYRELAKYMSAQNVHAFLRCIAVGIVSDTIGLTRNITEECRAILTKCQEIGIDVQAIANQLKSIDVRTQTLVSLAMERWYCERGIGVSYILQEDLRPTEYSLKTVNHKAIIQRLLDAFFCDTLILMIENDNHEIKGSMRTTVSNIDLNQLCATMVEQTYFIKGGGHPNSAGFTKPIPDTAPETLMGIYNHLTSAILGG